MTRTRKVALTWSVLLLGAALPAETARCIPPDRQAHSPWRSATRRTAPHQWSAPYVADGPSGGAACDYVDTGADDCATATVVDLPIGPAGNPAITTICGDNSDATAAGCALGPRWWEVLRLDRSATLTISLCGTDPVQDPTVLYLFDTCPCRFTVPSAASGRGAPVCADDNAWMVFEGLRPGSYYYSVFANPDQLVNPPGPYQLHIAAEEATGACCDASDGACMDDVVAGDCAEAQQTWYLGVRCCGVECRTADEGYDSAGIDLFAHVPLASFPFGQTAGNDIWGYTSASGQEFAIIGMNKGVGFVEVTDPVNPVITGYVHGGGTDTVWRDIKTLGSHAYLVSDASGVGLQIVDLGAIDQGDVALAFTHRLGVNYRTAHNIFINTDTAFAYLCGANAPTSGLVALDLTNRLAPQIAGTWSESHVHDVYVSSYGDCPYAARAGQPCEVAFAFCGGDGLKIVDVTDKSAMTTIGTLIYPTLGFCHQGWLADDGRTLFMDDELDESAGNVSQTTTYVVDVQNLADPQLIGTFSSGQCSIDHNLFVRRDRLYEANYTTGLRVFDMRDLGNIVEVAHFDTHPEGNNIEFEGAWGVYAGFDNGVVVVSDINRGLFVFGDPPYRDPLVSAKNRAISLVPKRLGPQKALRVVLHSLYLDNTEDPLNGCGARTAGSDLSAFEGAVRWVEPPAEYPEDTVPPMPNLLASPLTCCPHFRDWRPEALEAEFGADAETGLLHIVGPEVLPCSIYDVQGVDIDCPDLDDESCYSTIIRIRTAKFGDLWPPYGGTGQPDFVDIGAEVTKFKSLPFDPGPPISGGPPKALAMLRGNELPLASRINFVDIGLVVEGFRQRPYKLPGPEACTPCP